MNKLIFIQFKEKHVSVYSFFYEFIMKLLYNFTINLNSEFIYYNINIINVCES